MYSKCGNIDKPKKAFGEMHMRTLISWTSMISAFAQHGQSREALELFEGMLLAAEKPTKITFVGVFSACSQAGLVDEALNYFEMMKTRYKIKPITEHYACLIDMFVRLGRLEEAFDLTKKMGCEPNDVIWSILIAGCRGQGNIELGYYAAEKLIKLKPEDKETYFLLLNMYLSAGRFQDVSTCIFPLEEFQDWSWLSIKDTVYSFSPKSRSYLLKTEVDDYLGVLLDEVKSRGYQSLGPQVAFGEDDEVEPVSSSSVHHSEKLVTAFGLLQTSKTVPVRIVKSISMCRECHTFIKVVSEITGREIIVRDNKRLYRFINGHCSCGDFGNLLI